MGGFKKLVQLSCKNKNKKSIGTIGNTSRSVPAASRECCKYNYH